MSIKTPHRLHSATQLSCVMNTRYGPRFLHLIQGFSGSAIRPHPVERFGTFGPILPQCGWCAMVPLV